MPCIPLSDAGQVAATGLFTYPDVVCVCGESQFLDETRDTLLNPTLLIEVLSPSTEAYDRGRKFDHYRTIDSLREYLLVSSDRTHAGLYIRRADDRWLLTSTDSHRQIIMLESVDAQLLLTDLYDKVDFAVEL